MPSLVYMKHTAFLPILLLCLMIGSLTCKKDDFIERHWNHPIEPQGSPPESFTTLEAKLTPESCGTCHIEQFSFWKSSMHRDSASQGLRWQLHGLGEKKSENCFNCHSPLMETRTLIKINEGWLENYPQIMNVYFPSDSSEHGISCATCHVRNHTRYGPTPLNKGIQDKKSVHLGFRVQNEFESSQFCKKCHESKEDADRVSNKKMMETYTEWESSDYKRKGIQCQTCHMPNRNHLWKGIHDKEMVLSGIEKQIFLKAVDDEIEISAELRSTNIGHKFPTYVVPKIYLKLYLQSQKLGKKPIGDYTIGRLMDIHLTKEFYDNRLDPGESVLITAKMSREELKKFESVIFEADVQPDELYERMFSYNLENNESLGHSQDTLNKIQESLLQKQKSKYKLFRLISPISDLISDK